MSACPGVGFASNTSAAVSFLLTTLGLLAAAPVGLAQTQTLTTIPGTVHDLARTPAGTLIYCTDTRELGSIQPVGAVVTTIANSTHFPNPLRGVVCNQGNGDISVVDSTGDIYRLDLGALPAVKRYADLYMISDASDLMMDGDGNYFVASTTPSSGFRAINWINSNGSRWSYYITQNQPVGIAYDPITNNILMADTASGGRLSLVDTANPAHPVSFLPGATGLGSTVASSDGEMAVESSGNVLIASNGRLLRYDRNTNTIIQLATGLGTTRALAIAPSSGNIASTSGFSAYIATGGNPSTIREFPNVEAPSTTHAPSLGTVPNRGIQVPVNFSMNAFEIIADDNYDLLVGGDLWGANAAIRRISVSNLAVTVVANTTNGISSRVTGMSMGPDRSIYAVTESGAIQRITENPLSVTTIFSDPLNQIAIAQDILYDRGNGDFYVAARQGWGTGYITHVSPQGTANYEAFLMEPRGLAPDPFTGQLLYSEWINIGFQGRIGQYNPGTFLPQPLAGFTGINYSNAGVWADGDMVEDIEGNIYTVSEDDFSLYKYLRATGEIVRIGSGYLNHPAGVAIARSTATSGSTTGWSLYVAEYNYLWEIPSVPAPVNRNLDRNAPPVGRPLGYFNPNSGTLRAMVADPAGNGFLVSTSTGTIEHLSMSGVQTRVCGAVQGLSGDLTALGVLSTGRLVAANRFGNVWEIDPTNGYSAVQVFNNPGGTLFDVRSLAVDGQDRVILFERPSFVTSPDTTKVWRLSGGVITLLNFTNRGFRGAFDPISGDLFVPEQGNMSDGGGEILRLDLFANPTSAGHFRGSDFFLRKTGFNDGGISFNDAGDMFLPVGSEGRVYKIDRATGSTSVISGNYERPVTSIVAPGTPGYTGPLGASVFILDRHAIYEIPVTGSAPPPPSPTKPVTSDRADLTVTGTMSLGGTVSLSIASPADANRTYLIVASLSGKIPGFAFSNIDPTDDRVLPNNPDDVWFYVNDPLFMPDFVNVLDAGGNSPGTVQFLIPNDPIVVFNRFMDFGWIGFDSAWTSHISTVGGTAQLYMGF